jgi:hypothetical protein
MLSIGLQVRPSEFADHLCEDEDAGAREKGADDGGRTVRMPINAPHLVAILE